MSFANTASSPANKTARALQLHADDNVVVVLADVAPGEVVVLGKGAGRNIVAMEAVTQGHKIAVLPIAAGGPVIKYGVTIGFATAPIGTGRWVHTHNCRSGLDERSHTLDPHSGAATDTPYV